jgi:RNA polymerase sigma factor (sigma-70 family)
MKQDELVFHGENVMGMCIKAANAHKRNGLDHKDLLQQAFLGATVAAQSYDPSKGAKFSTHAYMSIRAYCQQAVQANRATSGSSRLAQTLFHKLPACQRELQTEGKTVNPPNIAEWLEANTNWSVSTSSVEDALQVVKARSVSMSATASEGDSKSTFGETLVSREMNQYEKLVRTRRGEGVREAMSTFLGAFLPTKQRRAQDKYVAVFNGRLVALLNGEDALTLEEVAGSLGTSKQRVGQIETELKGALANHVRDYI